MNAAGHAVGQVEIRRDVLGGDPGARHAFIFRDGQSLDLGTLGGNSSVAVAVNNSDIAVGSSSIASGAMRAFIASDTTMRDLGTLGGSFSSAQAVNDRGQIAGVSNDVNGNMYAFISDGVTMRALAPISDRSEQINGNVVALTNNGLVVMRNGQVIDTSHGGTSVQTGATFTDANDVGEIVGNMSFSGEAGYRAVVYRDGAFTNLGVLAGGMYSSATDINARGQVVGFSHLGSGEYHSFLYQDGVMHDIADLITGFTSVVPGELLLNDIGQVAGVGLVSGQYHAFLLTKEVTSEVPEPSTLAVSALGLGLLAWRRRRSNAART